MSVFVFFWLVIFGGNYFSSPHDKPIKTDAIVILGGGGGARLTKGVELYKAGFSKKIVLTGLPEMTQEILPTYSKWRLEYLLEQGIPRASVILNTKAKNSQEESLAIRNLMITLGWQKVLVVSDPPHLRRLYFIFSSGFKNNGELSFLFIASNPKWWASYHWWSNSTSAKFIISEVIKLIYFFSKGISSYNYANFIYQTR